MSVLIDRPVVPPRRSGWRRTSDVLRRPLVLLVLITLLGSVLRFASLDKPTVWGDEGATWSRVCGSWQGLTEMLRDRGLFMPGHYLIEWWIKEGFPVYGHFNGTETIPQGPALMNPVEVTGTFQPTARLAGGPIALTPYWLRLMPALCGIGMIPATYFLAVQLASRRTALLAALFAATSAYLLAYSRDAKMYVQFWCFATLSTACLLWWLDLSRTDERDFTMRSPVRWLSWIAAGCAMVFFHALGLILLLVQLLIVLTAPRTSGVFAIGELLRRSRRREAGAFREGEAPAEPRSPEVTGTSSAGASPSRNASPSPSSDRLSIDAEGPHPALSRSTGRGFSPRPRYGLFSVATCAVPALVWFLIGAAVIALPAYNFFRGFNHKDDVVEPGGTASSDTARRGRNRGGASPSEPEFNVSSAGLGWIEIYNDGRSQVDHWAFTAGAYLFSWELPTPEQWKDLDPAVNRRLTTTFAGLGALLAVGALGLRHYASRVPLGGGWRLDRPGPAGRARIPARRALWITGGVLLPLYIFYCLSVKDVRTPDQLLVSGLLGHQPTWDWSNWAGAGFKKQVAKVITEKEFAVKPVDFVANVKEIARAIFTKAPTQPWGLLVVAAMVASVLFWPAQSWTRRLLRVAAFAGAAVALFVALWAIFLLAPPQPKNLWMPRYPGFVWPFFAIAVAALVVRLPTIPLRWGAGALLVGANLVNYGARTWGPSEPPTQRIVADVLSARDDPSDLARVYYARGRFNMLMGGAPGMGTINSLPFTYYAQLATGVPITPYEARYGSGPFTRDAFLETRTGRNVMTSLAPGPVTNAERIARDALRGRVSRFVLWEELPSTVGPIDAAADPFAGKLPKGWEPVGRVQVWPVHDHWTWRKLYEIRRWEYRKVER